MGFPQYTTGTYYLQEMPLIIRGFRVHNRTNPGIRKTGPDAPCRSGRRRLPEGSHTRIRDTSSDPASGPFFSVTSASAVLFRSSYRPLFPRGCQPSSFDSESYSREPRYPCFSASILRSAFALPAALPFSPASVAVGMCVPAPSPQPMLYAAFFLLPTTRQPRPEGLPRHFPPPCRN